MVSTGPPDGPAPGTVTVSTRVARALRDDLLTATADPRPRPRERPRGQDWLPAIVVALAVPMAFLVASAVNQYAVGYGLGTRFGLVLAGTQTAALFAAVWRPAPAWWASTIAMLVAAGAATGDGGTALPWTESGLALQAGVSFVVALRVRPRAAFSMLVIAAGAGAVCGVVVTGHVADVVPGIAALTIAVVLGAALRGRRVARGQLVVQERVAAGERARRTLLEERQRIARELHDVVAHHMSVISIQAQVAPHLVEHPTDELRENLIGIRGNAIAALTELRHVLGVLRSDELVSDAARHTPQPTLDRLDELLDNVRTAGLRVETTTMGRRRALSPGVGLSAFRIVQEALSNAMRHAPGADVVVEIGYRASGVTVRVVNTVPGRPAAPLIATGARTGTGTGTSTGVGMGLLGMRERAAMLGGELATGPTPEGGWEVTALLPTGQPAEPVEDAL